MRFSHLSYISDGLDVPFEEEGESHEQDSIDGLVVDTHGDLKSIIDGAENQDS